MNIDQAIDRARKLFALATSDNANEAASAAAKAQEILDRHDISQAMLDTTDADEDEEIENFADKSAPLDSAKTIASWRGSLATAIATANQCKVYTSRSSVKGALEGKRTIEIIGRPSDVQKVRYLFAYLTHEVTRLVKRDARGCGRTWANNYRHGAVETLAEAIRETRANVAADMRAAADGLSLVRVNNALAKLDARASAVDLYARKNLRLSSVRSSARGNKSAHQQGREAGKEIKIGSATGALGSGQRWVGSGS